MGCGSAAENLLRCSSNDELDTIPMANSRGVEDEAIFNMDDIRVAVHVGEDWVVICNHSGKERQPNQISHTPVDRETTGCWPSAWSRSGGVRVLC